MQSVAIVSGASSGIGRACAVRLSKAGVRVFGMSRSAADDPGFEQLRVDVTDTRAVADGVAHVLAAAGRIDVLVNSAGYGLAGPIVDTSIDEARAQFDVNVFGAMRLCQSVAPAMCRQRAGLILSIGSLGGLFGLPFQGCYSASKFALEGLSEALAHELRPFGVDVVTVQPGDVRTGITRNRVTALGAGDPIFRGRFEAARRVFEAEEAKGVAPEVVAELVHRIWQSRRRRPQYLCGPPLQTLAAVAKRILPGRAFAGMIAGHYEPRPGAQPPSSEAVHQAERA